MGFSSCIKHVYEVACYPAVFIQSGSWIVLAWLVSDTGKLRNASAGYQVAIRNVVFLYPARMGMSNAAATLVGQNLGAKQPDRAEKRCLAYYKV